MLKVHPSTNPLVYIFILQPGTIQHAWQCLLNQGQEPEQQKGLQVKTVIHWMHCEKPACCLPLGLAPACTVNRYFHAHQASLRCKMYSGRFMFSVAGCLADFVPNRYSGLNWMLPCSRRCPTEIDARGKNCCISVCFWLEQIYVPVTLSRYDPLTCHLADWSQSTPQAIAARLRSEYTPIHLAPKPEHQWKV